MHLVEAMSGVIDAIVSTPSAVDSNKTTVYSTTSRLSFLKSTQSSHRVQSR